MLGGLRSAFLSVDDLDSAKAWYTDLVGHPPYFDEASYVGFDVGGYELGLVPSDQGGVEAAWAVDDPETAAARAVELGATVTSPPRDVGDGIIVASLADPFGNSIGLIRNPHFAPALVHTTAEDLSDRSIVVEKTVPVSADEAWGLWTSSDGLAAWWTENTDIDMRPGGPYEILFNPEEPPGDRGGDWVRILSFLPGRMLSFTWNAPPHLKTRPLHTWVVLTFEPVELGCRVALNHLGWPRSGLSDPDSDWPATFEYFENAWTLVMGRFESHLGDSL